VPNEDNYFVQQFRHQMCKFAIFTVEFMFDIRLKKQGGTGCPYPTCSFGNSFLHIYASLLFKYSPYGHDRSKTYPEKTLLSIKPTVVLIYKAQPRYMVLVSILH
jgi:hypothetical protein